MAGDWRHRTLGTITHFLSGGTPSKSRTEYWGGTVPWVSAKDMKRFRLQDTEDHLTTEGAANGTRLVPAGTVLMLTRGMTLLNDLPICIVEKAMAFNQDVKALRPRKDVLAAFLPYLLLGNRARLLSLVDLAGHGTGRLNSEELKALDVQLPPILEQRAIAHILGTIDDKLELNRRMNETLEAMPRALFKSWFIDFDPVRAKMAGRGPGLPKHIAKYFPDRLVECRLGVKPDGWTVRPLGDSIDVTRGLSYKGAALSVRGTPMHNLNSIYEGGGYKEDGIKYYDGTYKVRHQALPQDVLVANTEQGHGRRLIGYSAVAPADLHDVAIFSHHLYRVRPTPSSYLTPNYICQLLNSRVMHNVVSGYATGTTVNILPIEALAMPPIVMPPAQLAATFDSISKAMALRRRKLFDESKNLSDRRAALIQGLISGEVAASRS